LDTYSKPHNPSRSIRSRPASSTSEAGLLQLKAQGQSK
jgi:hypothetical protein